MLVRFVKKEEGRLRRFGFIPMWLEPRKPAIFQPFGPFTMKLAIVELKEERVTLRRPGRDEILVNGQPVSVETVLSHGGEVVLKMSKGALHSYEFQMDLALVKNKRRQEETALGIKREPPDFSGKEKHVSELRAHCRIDENQVGIGGRLGFKYFRWDQLDEITFSPQAGGGFKAGVPEPSECTSKPTIGGGSHLQLAILHCSFLLQS